MLTLFVSLFLTPLFQSSPLTPRYRPFFSHSFLFFLSRCGKYYMYVRTGGKLCYLATIQNAIPSASSFIHTTSSLLLLLPLSSHPARNITFSHPNLLLSSPYSTDLIPISYAVSLRIQNSSDIYSRAIVSFSLGYSLAYLGIHTKKLCV